jgi:hypothetical protein
MNLLSMNHITTCFDFFLSPHQVIHILLRQISELQLCTANTFTITVILLIIYKYIDDITYGCIKRQPLK